MAKEKNLDKDELEQTVRELQDQVKLLQEKIDFFIHPLLISLCNKVKESHPGIPGIMSWISTEFYIESDNTRKRFLRDLHDKLRKTIPMDLNRVSTLPDVIEEEVDFGIFER